MTERDERRKWPRLEVALRIRLKALGAEDRGDAEDLSFYTKNISTGGLFFEGGGFKGVGEGSVFDVEISMPLAKYGFTSTRRLEARGTVCRVEGASEGDRAGVAMEFLAAPRFVTS